MTDTHMKDRVKVVLNGSSADGKTSEHPLVLAHGGMPDQALQVLAMAQRTAEEHVGGAHRQADQIRAEAMAAAERIAREAEGHAQNVRREADKIMYDARAAAERSAREVQARVDEAARNAGKIVADARAQAKSITGDARAAAGELMAQAQQRYDDLVGSLGAKREGLQQQIEALEEFDLEYRARLSAFMQGQLRALWIDRPQVTGDLGLAELAEAFGPIQGPASAGTPGPAPAQSGAPGPAQAQSGAPAPGQAWPPAQTQAGTPAQAQAGAQAQAEAPARNGAHPIPAQRQAADAEPAAGDRMPEG